MAKCGTRELLNIFVPTYAHCAFLLSVCVGVSKVVYFVTSAIVQPTVLLFKRKIAKRKQN